VTLEEDVEEEELDEELEEEELEDEELEESGLEEEEPEAELLEEGEVVNEVTLEEETPPLLRELTSDDGAALFLDKPGKRSRLQLDKVNETRIRIAAGIF
jgi:hypothetical protein